MEENRKIKLLVVVPNKSGVGYYRSINPHTYMDEFYSDKIEISIVDKINYDDPSFGLGFDIIHFHSMETRNAKQLFEKVDFLKRNKVKTVMDLDDFWLLPTYFPQYIEINKKNKLHLLIIELLKRVDFVTTTTTLLQKKLVNIIKMFLFYLIQLIKGKNNIK